MNAAYWKGRRVFLTGHTGFKGSWLALWLAKAGAQVTGYALAPPTSPSNFESSGVRAVLAAHHEADIRDAARLDAALAASRPEVVFHLAAQPIVRESYATPRETFEVNVIGTAAVLDAIRAWGGPCVAIMVTSDKCYENREQVWGYRECDAMGGHDPYSASKGASELVVSSYRRAFFHPARIASHGVRVASARAGNVIGGGDWARDRIVTDVVASLAAGRPVPVRNPRAIRPWQHVLEPLSGYVALAEQLAAATPEAAARFCDGWNFGPRPGEEADVRSLVEAFIASWGSGTWQDTGVPGQLHEASVLRLAIDKAVAELGWRPRWDFAETVRRTAAWYHDFHAARPASMRDHCLRDIQAHEEASAPA